MRVSGGGDGVPPAAVTRRGLLLLGLGALVVRLAYAVAALRGYVPQADAHHYDGLAVAVAEGRGLVHGFPAGGEHPTAFRPPLWPLLLGAAYAVGGADPAVARVLTAGLGAVAVVGLAVLAGRLAGPVAARVAGAVGALHPALVVADAPPLSEPLGAVLLLGVLLALSTERVALAGLLSGGLLLTRPSAQAVLLVLAAALLLRRGWRQASVYAAVVVLVAAPWLVRNQVQLGAPVITTSQGFNLAATYSLPALDDGGFVDPVHDPRFAPLRAQVRAALPAGAPPAHFEAAQDAAFREAGLAGLREHPAAPVRVVADNVARLLAVPGDQAAVAADRLDGRPAAVRAVAHGVGVTVLALGAGGLVVLLRRRVDGALPLVLAVVASGGASLLLVAAPRLRHPVDLLCCIGVGVAVAALLPRVAPGLAARLAGTGPAAAGPYPPPPAGPRHDPEVPAGAPARRAAGS